MSFYDVAPSPREGRKYRGSRVESVLTNDCRKLSLSAGRHQGSVKNGHLRKCDIDGFLGREKAFGHLHGRIPACFEHKVSLFAGRSPAAIISALSMPAAISSPTRLNPRPGALDFGATPDTVSTPTSTTT